MKNNKHIERDGQAATKIFDNRSLSVDYRTLNQSGSRLQRVPTYF